MQDRQLKIQDILVMSNDKGEFNKKNSGEAPERNPVPRIAKLIKGLVKQAVKAHEKKNKMTLDYELITRLALNEFSLYTKDKPLSLDQYKELIDAIAGMANKLPPNIHLVIATMAVLWPDGLVHNVALHVQSPRESGAQAILHHLDKRWPHFSDPKYKYSHELNAPTSKRQPLYGQIAFDEALDNCHGTPHSPHIVLSDTPIAVNDIDQYNGAIRVQTQAGVEMVVTVEICREHCLKTAIEDVRMLDQQLKQNNKTLPKIGSHMIVSHHVTVNKDSLVAPVLHVDTDAHERNNEKMTMLNPVFGEKWTIIANQPVYVDRLNSENLNRLEPCSSLLFSRIKVKEYANDTLTHRIKKVCGFPS